MKRRILQLLVISALMIGTCVPAFAAEEACFVICPPNKLPAAGEEFTVTVDLEGNPGFCALQFTLSYDKALMECDSVDLGAVMDGTLAASNPDASNGAIVAAASASPVVSDGRIAAFVFTAKQDVAAWNLAITNLKFSDEASNPIPSTVRNETVPGDPTEPGSNEPAEEPEPQPPAGDPPAGAGFTDVPEDFWGAEYIDKAVALGLFTGYTDGSFHPNSVITRKDFVTVLWRAAGQPEPKTACPFTDVPAGQYYSKAVAWAKENGYVDGVSAMSFDPEGVIQRQAAMKILFAYSGGTSGMELMFTSTYDTGFRDSGEIASWAKTGMYWAFYNGIITGMGESLLSPQTGTTRAQFAKILVNYLDKYGQ